MHEAFIFIPLIHVMMWCKGMILSTALILPYIIIITSFVTLKFITYFSY